jgi:hypothetical protein
VLPQVLSPDCEEFVNFIYLTTSHGA